MVPSACVLVSQNQNATHVAKTLTGMVQQCVELFFGDHHSQLITAVDDKYDRLSFPGQAEKRKTTKGKGLGLITTTSGDRFREIAQLCMTITGLQETQYRRE